MKVLWSLIVSCFALSPMFGQVVENGEKPQGAAYTLDFSVDLKFGADEEDEVFLWPHSGTKIVADQRGHMFIVDPKEMKVVEFDANGKLVAAVLKAGQGPGELQGVRGFTALTDGGFIALDGPMMGMPKIKAYDQSFKITDEKLAQGMGAIPITAAFSPSGAHFIASYISLDMESQKMVFKTGIMDRSFGVAKELSSADRPMPNQARFQDPGYWAEFIAGNLQMIYKGVGVACFDSKNNIYTALGNQYEITKWSPDLKEKLLVIKRQYKPIANSQAHLDGMVDVLTENMGSAPMLQNIITPAVLKKALDLSEPPPVKNPVQGLIPMPDGGLIVVHDIDLSTRKNIGDIFDKDGNFLGQVTMDGFGLLSPDAGQFQTRLVFQNGFAYTILTDEEGDNRAVRLKYKLVKAKAKTKKDS